MKRLYTCFLIISLMAFSVVAKRSVTSDTRFRIEKLSTPDIKIGTKTLKQGDMFSASDEIHWSAPNQSMLVKNTHTSELVRFSQRISKKKGKIKSLLDFYKQINMGSTRGVYNYIALEKNEKSFLFPEKRIALVIGNQNYQFLAPLKNAQKDAEDVAATLLDLGFDVIELYETTYSEIMAGINKFAGLARDYDVALVYYAGHGIQEDNINYLVPVDNMLDRQADLRDCVSCNEIIQKVEDSHCPSKIFYFDACRDRKTSWSRSVLNGLSSMEGDAGTVIVFATQSGKVAADGDRDDNSPFAKMFIKNMRIPMLSFPEMMSALVRDTYNATEFHQYPVKVGDLITDFRFNPLGSTSSAPMDGESPYRTPVFREAKAYEDEKNYDKALLTYLKEPDNPWCQVNIGYIYFDGKGVRQDIEKAKEWFLKAAAKGDEKGMRGLGIYYYNKKDYNKAIEWSIKAAENGEHTSNAFIGFMYENGIGVPQDFHKANEWYQKGIKHEDGFSMAFMGLSYYYGKGVKRDYQKAHELFLKSVEKDNPYGMYYLAESYEKGDGVRKDLAKAVKWFKKSSENGYIDAYSDVARAYMNGMGVDQNNEMAYEWAKKGAEAGNSDSMFLIGLMYHTGHYYFNRDYKLAIHWYSKAIEYGHVYSKVCLANMYSDEQGLTQDYPKALQLYREAAAQNEPEAMLNIGIFYNLGIGGLKTDYKMAEEWYEKAAEGGNVRAMYNLAMLYDNSSNESTKPTDLLNIKNIDKAMKWYREAAQRGLPEAIYQIGNIYDDPPIGSEISKNPYKAFELFEQAALLGYPDAMYMVGIKYFEGNGVEKDNNKSIQWLKKAADAGNIRARDLIMESLQNK